MVQNKTADDAVVRDVRFYLEVLGRTLFLLVAFNLIFAAVYPLPILGKLTAYNRLFPGRLRLPYGENPDRAYNLSLFNLEAMFASHEISNGPKPDGEYRIILIGDSSTWGFLLPPGQTLAAFLNNPATNLPDGRKLRAYNLGYPVMSLAKDLMILHEVMPYQPDLIVWPITLESFPKDKQLSHPLLQHNPQRVRSLIQVYQLKLDSNSPDFIDDSFWDRTILGSRRPLADLLRLQLYGVMWAATGIDQEIPQSYSPRKEDLPSDASFHNLFGPHLTESDLAVEILHAGHRLAGQVPILLVNEPMFLSQGLNSHIRYNFFYPRWAYDDYRALVRTLSQANGWRYLDLWDAVDNSQFTNSAIHMTPLGTEQFAQRLISSIMEIASQNPRASSD